MVQGAAWSDDDSRVEAVDISTDRGQKWKSARFVGPRTQFGWRLWEFPWTPPLDGSVTLLARARDANGSVQPMEQAWNPSGYLWNVVTRRDVSVGKPAAAPLAAAPADVPAPEGFRETCTTCHEEDVIRQQRLTRAQWERELNKMTSWGAHVQPERLENLLNYLERLSNR